MLNTLNQLLHSTILIICCNAAALAAEPATSAANSSVKPALITELIGWIEENSDYDTSFLQSRPPAIEFCECGETIQYEDKTVHVQEHLKGLYDKQNYKIILVRPWDSAKPYDVSILLHELIHFVQYNSQEWACWPKTEWEAYKLQEAWLQERGYEPEFNWLQIYFLSRCPIRDPSDIHPFIGQDF